MFCIQLSTALVTQGGYSNSFNSNKPYNYGKLVIRIDLNPIQLQVKGKLIQLQNSLNTKFRELKAKIEASNTDLKRKINATDADLKGKIANVNADLQGRIDAEDAELKNNITSVIPNFNTLVDGKYMIHNKVK